MNKTGKTQTILPADRRAGMSMHLTSLPSPYGIGDIGDSALSFIDTLSTMHIGVWQFLPTGPTAFGDSPYQPLSAFAGNENLVGIEPLLRARLIAANEAEPLTELPTEFVNYNLLTTVKSKLLATAAERFMARTSDELKTAYEEFLHLADAVWLDDYALFRILKTKHAERPWPDWDKPFVHREPRAIQRIRSSESDAIERTKILQFLFNRQWRSLRNHATKNNICLFADMPIYIALDSADAWAHPEILRIDHDGRPTNVAGVPPDYFSDDGQLWGNPLYNWNFHAANGYQWWIERLRHASTMADLIRIDHFRGFEAYWSIPVDSPTAKNGRWEPGPSDALFNAVRDALGHLPMVAEDLGVITPAVDALRHRHRIPGMKVLQFDLCEPDFSYDDIAQNSVCYTGTHDNDTTAGWFKGGNGDTRTAQEVKANRMSALHWTGGTAATIHTDMIRFAFTSKAKFAVVPMQDYLGLGSTARLNIPGTTQGNWKWRLQSSQLTPELCAAVAKMVDESSRS